MTINELRSLIASAPGDTRVILVIDNIVYSDPYAAIDTACHNFYSGGDIYDVYDGETVLEIKAE